jgi:hypothetical protein
MRAGVARPASAYLDVISRELKAGWPARPRLARLRAKRGPVRVMVMM